MQKEEDIVGLMGVGEGYINELGDDGVRILEMLKKSQDIIRGLKLKGIGKYKDEKKGKS